MPSTSAASIQLHRMWITCSQKSFSIEVVWKDFEILFLQLTSLYSNSCSNLTILLFEKCQAPQKLYPTQTTQDMKSDLNCSCKGLIVQVLPLFQHLPKGVNQKVTKWLDELFISFQIRYLVLDLFCPKSSE